MSDQVEIGLLVTPDWHGLTVLSLIGLNDHRPCLHTGGSTGGSQANPPPHPSNGVAYFHPQKQKKQAYRSQSDRRCFKASLQEPCSPMSNTGDVFTDGLKTMGINFLSPFL